MRRSRMNLHSSQQVALGESGFYSNPSDPPFTKRVVGMVSESLWSNLPVMPALGLNGIHFQVDRFLTPADIDETKWTSVKDDEGALAPALVSGPGGGVIIQSGNQEHGSYNFLHSENETMEFEQGKSSWIQFNAMVEHTGTSENLSIAIGFQAGEEELRPDASENSLEVLLYDNEILWVTTDVDGESDYTVYNSADEPWFPITDDIANGETPQFHNWGLHIEPSDADSQLFDLHIFFDGSHFETLNDLDLPSEPLHPYVGTLSHSDRITLRNIVIIQED